MGEKLRSYKDLEVWKVSMSLVTRIYEVARSFPTDEKFGLTSQIKRAAISIPSNIAEGASRKSTKEFIQFLYISNGSLSELETQIELAFNLKFITNTEDIFSKIKHIRRMLINLIHALKQKNKE